MFYFTDYHTKRMLLIIGNEAQYHPQDLVQMVF